MTRSHTVSPAKSLFLGNINEENLFPFPPLSSSEEETLKMVLESVDRFMETRAEDFRRFDREGAQPEEYLQALRELGLFGLIIPEEYGGIGLSNAGYSRVLQQTSRYDASTSLTIGAHSSIGMKGVLLFGSPEQKKRYLPKLASGEMIASFCLTEAGSGSDAASIKTTATKNSDGSWILNGEKIWITNGAMAEFFTVFARTEGESGKMSAFLVERSFGGVTTGPKEDKLGIRASATTTVAFHNVRIPAENVLGTPGDGFRMAMSILNNGRTGLGGGCVGAMKRCIALATKQAGERKQFGKPIATFGLVKEKIAQMTVGCFAAESVVNMVAQLIDAGHSDYSVEAAISKIFATEALWMCAHEALQIAGGNGFMKEFPYEGIVRDSRINMIFEGTNEILRLYVALSGFKDAGEELKQTQRGVTGIFHDPIKGFGLLSKFMSKKFTQLTSLGGEHLRDIPPELEGVARTLEQQTVRLGKAVETLLVRVGREIVGKQFISKRVADITIDLLVGLCVLSRVRSMVQSRGAAGCKEEILIAHLFIDQAKQRMNSNFRGLISHNDVEMELLADHISASGYHWDVL